MKAGVSTWHTGFVVSDLARACSFFREVLDFKVSDEIRPHDGVITAMTGVPSPGLRVVFVTAPDHLIELLHFESGSACPPAVDVARPGTCHLAFIVDDLDTVLRQCAVWKRHAVRPPVLIDAGPRRGWRICYTADPDGIVIEFAQKPEGKVS
jgi:catechol 2,3-dioxygenase-like lactoylglutathione lyase family enzyme